MRFFYIIVFCTLFLNEISADPWGKDADIVHPSACTVCVEQPTLLARCGIRAIRFHQQVISPADGPRSHFIPSSSQYTLEAMQKYGFIQGFTMGCDRLMRENSDEWVYRKIEDNGKLFKHDPVR